ncbi:MAG TPA: tetratricopeptide repeat protein [Terriglobia bacterium]|nr:tetratricopeptide repeat protein [Terriglobia bacterium]
MKKETVITAVVFLSIGFLAGYVFEAERAASPAESTVATAGQSDSADSTPASGVTSSLPPADAPSGLPPGHPPIANAAVIKTFTDQAAENPTDPKPRLELADYYYDQRQFEAAVDWYQKALALDPSNTDARTDLGTCYFNLGRFDDALAQFSQALKIDPQHKPTIFNVIVVNLEGKRDFAAAQKAWDQLHALDPSYQGLDQLKQALDAARASASTR